jgi:hypothetical protein
MRRTYVRRSEHEMKRNAEIGLFTKPSNAFALLSWDRGLIFYHLLIYSLRICIFIIFRIEKEQ